ncbi:MAG: hypothetical protein ACJ79X_03780 [Gemmatimonadaceae bacterium]|jgi:hypothetical protein
MKKTATLIFAMMAGAEFAAAQTATNSAGASGTASPPMRPPPAVCVNDPERHRFDFWIGEWNVTTPGGTTVGSSVIEAVSGGCALLENWTSASGGHGKSLNAYNPSIKQWQQYWIGQDGAPTEFRSSEFDGKSLAFFVKHDGSARMERLTFTPVDASTVRQHSETTEDGGKSWKTGYDFYYHRKDR